MSIKTTANRVKEYHEYLRDSNTLKFNLSVDAICFDLGISATTYYRKLNNPKAFSIAEKAAIAKVYELPVHFIFPEMQTA